MLVLSRFCLTSLDSLYERRDRADLPLSGEEGQKRRREFCAGYACTRIWERFKATYSRDVLVEIGGKLCTVVCVTGAERERVGGEREKREGDGRDGRERAAKRDERKREKRKEMRKERERYR